MESLEYNKFQTGADLLAEQDARMQFYYDRLSGKLPENIYDDIEQSPKILTGQDFRAMEDERMKKYHDKLSGKNDLIASDDSFDEKVNLVDYENEVSKNSKIYTKEDIDSMSAAEYSKNEKAIKHQKEKIGIPTKEQADKAVSSGGMVYVSGYTRGDGVEVSSYYRSRPSR